MELLKRVKKVNSPQKKKKKTQPIKLCHFCQIQRINLAIITRDSSFTSASKQKLQAHISWYFQLSVHTHQHMNVHISLRRRRFPIFKTAQDKLKPI